MDAKTVFLIVLVVLVIATAALGVGVFAALTAQLVAEGKWWALIPYLMAWCMVIAWVLAKR